MKNIILFIVLSLIAYSSGDICIPKYNLPNCTKGTCVNVKNDGNSTVWVTIVQGSPETVYAYFELSSGSKSQQFASSNNIIAGRAYVHYRNPLDENWTWNGQSTLRTFSKDQTKPLQFPAGMPQEYAQKAEFNTNVGDKSLTDYDISNLDSVALPLYMSSPSARIGGKAHNPECEPTFAYKGATFQSNCATKQISKLNGFAQCMGACDYCLQASHTDPFCKVFGSYNFTKEVYCGSPPLGAPEVQYRNRGLCKKGQPLQCVLSGTPYAYRSGFVMNEYAAWIHNSSYRTYGFSYDEGEIGGNTNA
eukprot:CAMPEP_0203751458 /NCGR_PEP_ID=MMETSP0098-20131031/5527_1 /ASSEMBLY_ACC=CAM_ASM_000208 /TAXON_ID=96639 /ORGANISM=" , Strain NY0313808BC1" /LENGTH=304 /DNA_ID=CAMNT_0050641187 /DNA_START=72 /DNA_END=987 /DNA_ORIENTATION=+